VPQRRYDFRQLPYRSGEFDVHVFDPPYMQYRRVPRQRIHDTDYKNGETTKGFSHADIIQLYRDGMVEGFRILKPGGLMLVKCKDEIVNGQQKMSNIEIHNIAVFELGMKVEDQFVLTQLRPLLVFGRSPGHAKKNHSFLWVFRKPA
jgi:DNA modification methylase